MDKYPGFFITLEGPEGCGKTSQIPPLVDHLRSLGIEVYSTREPGGSSIGEQIRDVLHDKKNTEMHPRTETLLYQAARAQFVEQIVIPELAEGKLVISDRFLDSTVAYQGFGHRQNIDEVKMLVRYATGGLMPDLSILLDVDTEVGLSRKKQQDEINRMDMLSVEFHRRVRAGYREIVKMEPERWRVIDAGKSKSQVLADLISTVDHELGVRWLPEGNKRSSERY